MWCLSLTTGQGTCSSYNNSCTTGQYHNVIYFPGSTFGLCHKWDTIIIDIRNYSSSDIRIEYSIRIIHYNYSIGEFACMGMQTQRKTA